LTDGQIEIECSVGQIFVNNAEIFSEAIQDATSGIRVEERYWCSKKASKDIVVQSNGGSHADGKESERPKNCRHKEHRYHDGVDVDVGVLFGFSCGRALLLVFVGPDGEYIRQDIWN